MRGPGRGSARIALVAGVVAALVVTLVAVRFASSSTASDDPDGAPLPAPTAPAFAIPTPRGLAGEGAASRWATVARAVSVRETADPASGVIASLSPRTPEDTTNVVLVEGSTTDDTGRLWTAVRVPALPQNVTGWVPRNALGANSFVRTRLVVDLDELRATLLRDGRPVFEAGIGIGAPAFPTPRGEFYVRSKLRSLSPFYGPLAFGTSARSPVLTDWPDGGFIGVHGTNRPELLPGRVSHGCIRMRNEDILELGRLMPVGTPVTIR
jgi:lipoprotein-anchoring transpeptidase ErfK/SrfK